MSTDLLRLGTRGSQLALYQARSVATQIAQAGGPPCALVIIKTSGDRLQDAPLSEIGIVLRRYRGRLEAIREPEVGGKLQSKPVAQGGVATALLRNAQWRARSGGEQFQRAVNTPPRSLKKQFQGAAVPAWQRDAPLLFSQDGRLLFVPGLGIDARVLAAPGEAQRSLTWVRR